MDGDAHAALVAYHLEAGNLDAASVAAQAAVTAMPQSLDMLELQARTLLQRGEAQQALSSYAKMTSLAPRDPRGHVGTIDIHLRTNDLDDARRAVDRALQAAPGTPALQTQAFLVAVRSRQAPQALAIARKLQAERPGDAQGWILEAELEASQQKWGPAALVYRKAMDKAGADGVLLKYLHVLDLDGRATEARAFAAARLKAEPNDLALRFYLGDKAQREGDLKLARQHYQDLLKRQPDHVPALNNLAGLQLAMKQPGALAMAKQAALLAPRQPAVLDTLAQAQAAEGSLGDAITTERQAVTLAPEAADLRLALAKLLVRNGDRAEARQHLGKLAALGTGFGKQAEVAGLLQDLGPLLRQ
jgi:putative PEP-CTERM system TPR-repeat lipoprotein